MEPMNPNQAEHVAGLDRAGGQDEDDDGANQFEEEEVMDEDAENDQQEQAGVLNEAALAQQDGQQDGPARVDLEKSSEESQSSFSGRSESRSSPNVRAQLQQLPSLLQKAVASVQKKLLQNNGDENGGRGGGGRQAVSSDDDDSSEDNQGSAAGDSTQQGHQQQQQQQYTDMELRRLVLELAIVEQLIELRRIRAAPVLTNRSTILEAAVLVWQKLQSQPGAEVLLDVNPAPPQPPAPAVPPQQHPHQLQNQQLQARANIAFAAPTHAGLVAAQQQQQHAPPPQVFPLPFANGIGGPAVAPLPPPPPIAAVDQQTQVLLMEILAGARSLLDPAWVQAQIVSDTEQSNERRKRQRCDDLYNFRYQDDESSSSYAPSR